MLLRRCGQQGYIGSEYLEYKTKQVIGHGGGVKVANGSHVLFVL